MSRDGMAGVVWKETMVALGPATNKNHERSISLEGLEQNRHLIDTARDSASFSVSGPKPSNRPSKGHRDAERLI